MQYNQNLERTYLNAIADRLAANGGAASFAKPRTLKYRKSSRIHWHTKFKAVRYFPITEEISALYKKQDVSGTPEDRSAFCDAIRQYTQSEYQEWLLGNDGYRGFIVLYNVQMNPIKAKWIRHNEWLRVLKAINKAFKK